MKPSLAEFTKLANSHRYIPVSMRIMGDTLTPVKVYQAVRAVSPYSYLLESVQQDEKLGRFSWIGLDPLMVFESVKRQITVRSKTGVTRFEGNPLDELFTVMESYRPVLPEELFPYQGGVVGYFGYDTIRHIEQIPDRNPDQLGIPESMLILPKTVIVFDHLFQTITLITLVEGTENDAYGQGQRLLEKLLASVAQSGVEIRELLEMSDSEPLDFTSNMSREEYIAAVKRAKHYILEGDIFQVVLSQRLSVPFKQDTFDLYRALRRINPSPYLFYLSYPEFQIAGSSPEILVKRSQKTLTLRPIAGTRKIGKTAEENAIIAADLLHDPKEVAEHMMLVDLGRNDLGRISKFGSVKPTQFKYIENYSHVMHIVTNLESTLQEGKSNADLIKATFPAGTLTGAPKVRAMEIIDELECTRRGFYGGAVANIDFNGNFDSCIGIRSVLVKDGEAYIQAGAGIVADSIPEKEYDECLNKASAVIRAIQLARRNNA